MQKQKVARIIGIVAIVVVLITAMVASFNQKTPNSELVWDEAMTIGDMNAENYFIIYSDIACPYCVAFENAVVENWEDFTDYVEKNNILVEVRLSDFLYEYGQSSPIASRYSAEAAYCAKREGKFWEYYDRAIPEVWNNYFKSSGKSAFDDLNALPKDYWIKLGTEVGLGESFSDCVKNNETLDEIVAMAAKTSKNINGMPYFKFNKYISSGFDLSWDYSYVKMYLDSGLKAR